MAEASVVEHKRATVRPDKGDTVSELTESFTSSTAAVLTEYRGLTVKQITDLRVALGADTTYAVVKNTLTKIAAGNAGLSGLDALLAGPTAVAFVGGDPVTAAKALRDFAKAHPALVVKGGVMDGKPLTAEEIKKLADLESREVLLSKMAGALKASLTNAVYLFAAPLAQAARAMGALEAKAAADPSVLAGGAGTPAPVAVEEAPEAVSEAPAEDASEEATDAAPAAEDTTEAAADADAEVTSETTSETE
jgi:large subunit ribosomal protein L10